MKISFLLPGMPWRPVGGFRVIYEYANNLVRRGYDVTVIHPSRMGNIAYPGSIINRIKKDFGYSYCKLFDPGVNWLPVDKRVNFLYVKEPVSERIPDSDVVFATAWQTVEYVVNYPEAKGRKFYLVMDFDPWLAPREKLELTWKLPLKKIAISNWMADKVRDYGGEDVTAVPLGIDHKRFCIINEICNREKTVLMMYSIAKYKDLDTGLKALQICRDKYPDFKVNFFGPINKRPNSLPEWITYLGTISDKELVDVYNRSGIFVSSSIAEGFAFPPAEAMACGCAVVSTDCGGNRDYAVDMVNSLISSPSEPAALAENILKLLKDDDLRVNLAQTGNKDIKEFTWEKSTDLLEQEITRK